MRPSFRTFLCLLPLAPAAAIVYLLARAHFAQPYHGPLNNPRLPKTLDQGREEEIRWAELRGDRQPEGASPPATGQ